MPPLPTTAFATTFVMFTISACAVPDADAVVKAQPRPPLHDDFLDHLTGDWQLTRSIRGTTTHDEVSARWILGHQFVRLHMIDVQRPPAYEAMVLIGHDQEHAQYVAHWCDSFGGGYSGIGRGVRRGNAIEFRFDYADGPFFNTFTWDPATGTWSCRLENGLADGTRKPFAEDRLVRR
ncbi:MAG TPA: hypothetical protein VK348_10775 [Planctomycetota bacterium]|nr:hypothetical protein [Planctomycetota bacterium]